MARVRLVAVRRVAQNQDRTMRDTEHAGHAHPRNSMICRKRLARPGAINGSERAAKPQANRFPVRPRVAEQHDVADGRAAEKCGAAYARELRGRELSTPEARPAQLELAPQCGRQR